MAENEQQTTGRPGNYKLNRGGKPAESGPFIGIVMNNVDPTRQGRLQVMIQDLGGSKKDGTPATGDKSQWRTVSYCPPFFGIAQAAMNPTKSNDSTGKYPENTAMSYGMWFPPPDLGTQVLCFFVSGDQSRGYYFACIPQEQSNHMVPAIGAAPKNERVDQNKNQSTYVSDAALLPVTEINQANKKITDNDKFYDEKKPVHSYVAAILFNQGIDKDPVRGPITSSSQRESPSQCYGISTPGRPIYRGKPTDKTVKKDSETSSVQAVEVIGRYGGHSLVMDDGDQDGKDNLIRIRTAKGHQITMSDDGNFFYIIHSNGQTWIEMGQEGTVDVFSTNSVNVRTKGTINLHADADININAGGTLSIKSQKGTTMQSETGLTLAAKGALLAYSQVGIGVKSDGTIGIQGKSVGIGGGSVVNVNAGKIKLNGGGKVAVPPPPGLTEFIMPDTSFKNDTGWQVKEDGIKSICTRAPTHEPYPYHNQGVQKGTSMEPGQPAPTPGAPAMPGGWSITKK